MFKRNKGIEAWVCYTTISFELYESWAKTTHQQAFFFLAPDAPLLRKNSIRRAELHTRPDIKPYTLKQILLLALDSCFSGSRLRIRVPNLYWPICHKYLLLLRKLELIKLELYDDGFLGVVETPSVCKYLQPVFDSVCSWNIEGWKLSDSTMRCLSGRQDITLMRLPLENLCNGWLQNSHAYDKVSLVIIEAKYMDYHELNNLIEQKLEAETNHLISVLIPKYFQHPRVDKQNTSWPANQKRELICQSPIECYLFRTIAPETHIMTGMTSTTVLICDLIRKGVLPRCRFTLLLSTKSSNKAIHCLDELYSFINFMLSMYSNVVDLAVILDGHKL